MVVWGDISARVVRLPIGLDTLHPLAPHADGTLRDPRAWGFDHGILRPRALFVAGESRRTL